MRPADLVLTGGTVVTMDAARRVYQDGYVAITNGRVVGVGAARDCDFQAAVTRQLSDSAVLPGLVNGHTHLSNGISRGLFDELPLADWVERGMWPSLRASRADTAYEGARVSLAENLLNGVTTTVVGEFGSPNKDSIEGVLRAVTESRSRSVVARISVDSADDHDPSQATAPDVRESIDEALSEVRRLRGIFGSDLVEVVPEALGVLRCTPQMVREFTAFARAEGTRMTMHVASSPDERDEALRRFGKGSIERLADLDALGPHLLIAHCVWPNENERKLLAESLTGVSHNPVANLMYASGLAPLAEMIDAGVRVGLGTDGASTNNGQNMWEVMKSAIFLQKSRFGAAWGSAELALELATIGGARAIGLDEQIGSLEVGKRADLVVVDLLRPHLVPRSTWPSNLVYSGNPDAVRTVLVEGEVLVDEGRLTMWDHEEVVRGGDAAAERMNVETGLAHSYHGRSRWSWDD
ncbi:amidohydrolase family protein [Nocardioides pantholopis]|uniref:amidohydrolase family protein n=1 Tax=Nocardioides pantholopis TaxID=2483798 RepID=UPI000F097A03|nr:amidohydrolase [Nocardioides pantholopis]